MAYPSLPIAYTSSRALETDRRTERASNGATRGRVLFTAAKSKFQIKHEGLTSAQMTTFRDFYGANLASSFTLVWPATGGSFTCIFASDPVETPTLGLGTDVSVEVQEV